MFTQIIKNWWVFLLRGILAVTFGALVMLWPATILVFFAIFAIGDGLLALSAAIFGFGKGNAATPTWWLILVGIAGLLAGIATITWPLIAAFTLTICIGTWCFARGLLELFGALGMPAKTAAKGWIIFSALLSILFGALVIFWPVAGAISITWVIAFYAFFIGFSLIGFSFRARSLNKNIKEFGTLNT